MFRSPGWQPVIAARPEYFLAVKIPSLALISVHVGCDFDCRVARRSDDCIRASQGTMDGTVGGRLHLAVPIDDLEHRDVTATGTGPWNHL